MEEREDEGWLFRGATLWERAAAIVGGLLLVCSSVLLDMIGFGGPVSCHIE